MMYIFKKHFWFVVKRVIIKNIFLRLDRVRVMLLFIMVGLYCSVALSYGVVVVLHRSSSSTCLVIHKHIYTKSFKIHKTNKFTVTLADRIPLPNGMIYSGDVGTQSACLLCNANNNVNVDEMSDYMEECVLIHSLQHIALSKLVFVVGRVKIIGCSLVHAEKSAE